MSVEWISSPKRVTSGWCPPTSVKGRWFKRRRSTSSNSASRPTKLVSDEGQNLRLFNSFNCEWRRSPYPTTAPSP
jgi:hypothetical protein